MNFQTLDKLLALGQTYGPWALVVAAILLLVWLLIRRGFSLTFQFDVPRRR